MVNSMIEGVSLFPLCEIADERGSVLHVLRSDAPDFTKFGECYLSEIVPGAVKAWKKHTLQTQNITVPVGRIRIVLYDNRETSSSNGKLEIFEIGRPDAYIRIKISPGIWYGFTCLSQQKAMLINCADIPHSPAESQVMPIDDSVIPYKWQ
jgi:dTDP-4-dehydrorhamnose 3,5-epimerase